MVNSPPELVQVGSVTKSNFGNAQTTEHDKIVNYVHTRVNLERTLINFSHLVN